MKKNSVKVLSALVAGLLAQVAYAGSITDIKVSVLPNKQRVIKFKFNKDAVEPTGFITSSPARITLDFSNTDLKVKQPTLTFNDNLLNQIVTAQSEGNTRVLLGLGQEGQYNVQVKGNEVWVQLSEARSSNSAPVSAVPAARSVQTQSAYSSSVPFNIDFHKGGNNSGVVEFSSNFTGEPQVRSQSDRLVITLKNYPLPAQAQRNLDVTDFSTPVRTISVRRVGNDTQITLRNQGTWKHTITGKNGRQSIQITPTKNVTELGIGANKTKQKFTGKRISLDFQNVDVRTVLQILATESGMNIVASDSVQGKMTLSLKDVPWDQALDLILDARELDMRRVGNIINVAPRAEMLARDKAELTARKELDDLGPLISQSFQLKYKNVEEFKKILRISDTGSSSGSSNNSILTSRGSALIDPATNTLIVNDVKSVIQKFNALIEELDVPARQVMVEARIVEASDTLSRELGVKFGGVRAGSTSWANNWGLATERNSRGVRNGSSGVLFEPNINVPVASAVGSIAVVKSFSSVTLGLELSASEAEGRSKTISTPRVLTQDRQEAEIKQGYQVPYTTRDSDGSTTTSFKDAVMSLKVLPRITPDNKIIMDVTINKDTPDNTYQSSEGEPSIRTQSVKTQAMIEDGGTLVVGGVYQEVIQNNVKKVPMLGDLPVLGNLFKTRSRNNSRNELLFFITPRIMGSETSVMRY
ncbi:type IV pilus secretin PilQ [Kingella oralis]|jgi:type IV pilus secretin pilQ|uniref:Type IV pilus biogenesis and competence protein PilQ n=1 Tax=Kingella oralis ATCC 51147 TaxID=629741 RepID=C4GJD7_9NEIS|nr:type IV pilus secretin PilQ [Kingella oralis]EEP67909.1 type IV pilus secretin PilQ [Kingella oralis ATCC 51147]QMT43287.1 type IV pilus secretin PilQ [Kingella oralis]